MSAQTVAAPDLATAVFAVVKPQIEQANTIAAQIAQHDTDPNALVSNIRDNEDTEHDAIKAFQDFRTKLYAKLEQETSKIEGWIREHAMPAADTEVDVEALKAQYKDLRSKVTTALGYLKSMEVSEERIAELPDLKTLRGTTASTKSGDGPKRPRFSQAFIDGTEVYDEKDGKEEGEKIHVINFTILAQKLSKLAPSKIDASVLRMHVYEMAKTEDLGTVKSGTAYEWDQVTGNSENSKSFKIRVVI